MARGNSSSGRTPSHKVASSALSLRERGLRAWQAGRFDEAIQVWSVIVDQDSQLVSALAEAHYRRGIARPAGAEQRADLERALALRPDDIRFPYHLGLALHRMGDLAGAIACYKRVLEQNPRWPGVGRVLGLAVLEQNPQADVTRLPGSTPAIQAALAPVQALLSDASPSVATDKSVERLWSGLALIRNGDGAAGELLDDPRPLPAVGAAAVRQYYLGVVAAQKGDIDRALAIWQHVFERRSPTLWLRDNLAAAILQGIGAASEAGDQERALAIARSGISFAASSTALGQALVQQFDRSARAAAMGGDWAEAAARWEDARQIVSASTGLGSPRPLLHNLALAYEGQERWLEAAEAWRAMLRTRPRKSDAAGQAGDDQWAWIRRRVLECYRRAGAPGEAVAVFRLAIKAAPDDLDLRIELAEALIANEQPQAAYNELHRVLAVDPLNADARIRSAALLADGGDFQGARRMLTPVLATQPKREDARRQMAQLLLSDGEQQLEWGRVGMAMGLFEEGQELAPQDYRFPLNLARAAISQRKPLEARPLLQRTLELGTDQADAYLQVIDCWVTLDDLTEARTTLARAETVLPLTTEFFIALGVLLMRRDTLPAVFNPFVPPPPLPKTLAGPRSELAIEVLDRGLALRPDDALLRIGLAAQLMQVNPAMALRYAEEGARLAPHEPEALMLLGLLQGLNDQVRAGKATLRRGARLARQQGNPTLAQQMEETRRELDSPMLPLILQMGPLLEEFADEDEEPW